jgi:hypothetical protein
LRALADLSSSTETAYVNALTSMAELRARRLMSDGLGPDEAIGQAEGELRSQLGLVEPEGIGPGTSLNLLGEDTDANAYLVALSCVLAQAAICAGGPVDAGLQELVNGVALDLESDGELDGALVDQLAQAEFRVDAALCVENLTTYLQSNGGSGEVADPNRALDWDGDGIANAVDDDADGDELTSPNDAIAGVAATSRGPGEIDIDFAFDAGGRVWWWAVSGNPSCSDPPSVPLPQESLGLVRAMIQIPELFVVDTTGALRSWSSWTAPPQIVPGVSDVQSIASRDEYYIPGRLIACDSEGRAWRMTSPPVQMTTAAPVVAVTVGAALSPGHSLDPVFLADDGTVLVLQCQDWGTVACGQGANESYVPLPGVPGVVAIASGVAGTAMLGASGQVWTLPVRDEASTHAPNLPTAYQVDGLPFSTSIAVPTDPVGLAVADNGTLWQWQFPSGPAEQVEGASGIAELAGGRFAIMQDGTLAAIDLNSETVLTPIHILR